MSTRSMAAHRTGLTATVISYRSKSAIRETAKVFGLSDDIIAALNQMHWGWGNAADLKGVKPCSGSIPTIRP